MFYASSEYYVVVGGSVVGGESAAPDCCAPGMVPGSSRCRRTAVRAGESCASTPLVGYGDSYCCVCAAPASSVCARSLGSIKVDLPRFLLPDEELDWLVLFWAMGVNIDNIDIPGPEIGRVSSGGGGSIDDGSGG